MHEQALYLGRLVALEHAQLELVVRARAVDAQVFRPRRRLILLALLLEAAEAALAALPPVREQRRHLHVFPTGGELAPGHPVAHDPQLPAKADALTRVAEDVSMFNFMFNLKFATKFVVVANLI